jgi:hypothetical protein
MNKLLFTFENDWGDDIQVIANNHKDLEDYLNTLGWYYFEFTNNEVRVVTGPGFAKEYGTLKWIKHV